MKKKIWARLDAMFHKIPLIGRIYHELIMLITTIALLLISKDRALLAENPALQLLCFKGLLVSSGIIHATITRKILFPYIDFKNEPDGWKKGLVITLYGIIIYIYGSGG